jgi:hypothetical protein
VNPIEEGFALMLVRKAEAARAMLEGELASLA